MEMDVYQGLAARSGNDGLTTKDKRVNYALGLGECGELQNIVKKHIYHGKSEEEARGEVLDEAGDCLWYIAMLLEAYGLDMADAAAYNISKLKKRYPEGFSEEASQNRPS